MIARPHRRKAFLALGVLLPLIGLAVPAQAQSQQVAPTDAARLELRVQQLENQVRSLTGRVEELTYKLNQMQSAPAAQSQVQTQPQNQAASQGDSAYNTQTQGQIGAGQTQVFGTVSQSSVDQVRSQAPAQGTSQGSSQTQGQYQTQTQSQTASAVQLPSGTPKEKYDYAFDLLRQANYPAAEQAFRSFLQQHPNDSLAGNAKYWLGETYYVRGDNQNAAIVFAEGFQEYPNSSKAPDNLLKLGMALSNLGSTQDACGTFSELRRRYPNAASTILRRAEREQSRLGCG
jgi:tol-pal system protein YbgF